MNKNVAEIEIIRLSSIHLNMERLWFTLLLHIEIKKKYHIVGTVRKLNRQIV